MTHAGRSVAGCRAILPFLSVAGRRVAQIAKENTMKWHWLCGVVAISALSVLTQIDLGASRAAQAGAPTTGAVAAQGTGTPTPRPAPCPST